MSGRTRFVDAILLRSIDYRDADRVVTFLTPELGRISVLARGARSSRRRFGGSLSPFCVIRAEVGQGRGELGRLAQAQVLRTFPGILSDLRKMTLAGAALALVRIATPEHEPEERVFRTVVELLETLDGAEAARPQLLIAFQMRLLAVTGFSPGLTHCAACGKAAPEGQAALLDPARGGIVCRGCGGGPLKIAGRTRARLLAATTAAWASGAPWSEEELAEADRAVSEIVAGHLGKRPAGTEVIEEIELATRPRRTHD